jgi:hypothetical protein
MHDESDLHEVDARVRAALTPASDAGRRVASRALTIGQAIPSQQRRRRGAVAIAALLAVLVVAGVQWSRTARRRTSPSLSITSQGSMLVVESQNGRRWIVGSPPARPTGGHYVIVVPGTEKQR